MLYVRCRTESVLPHQLHVGLITAVHCHHILRKVFITTNKSTGSIKLIDPYNTADLTALAYSQKQQEKMHNTSALPRVTLTTAICNIACKLQISRDACLKYYTRHMKTVIQAYYSIRTQAYTIARPLAWCQTQQTTFSVWTRTFPKRQWHWPDNCLENIDCTYYTGYFTRLYSVGCFMNLIPVVAHTSQLLWSTVWYCITGMTNAIGLNFRPSHLPQYTANCDPLLLPNHRPHNPTSSGPDSLMSTIHTMLCMNLNTKVREAFWHTCLSCWPA